MDDNRVQNEEGKGSEGRREGVELLVMLLLLLPGLGLLITGFKLHERSGGFTTAAALLLGAGACLMAAGGAYHFAKDYAPMGIGKGIAAFAAVTLLSLLAAALATGTLGGLLGSR